MFTGGWIKYLNYLKTYSGLDFQEYRLDGQIVFEYSVGPLRTDNVNGFSNYYRDLLIRKDISEQREDFNKKLPNFIEKK